MALPRTALRVIPSIMTIAILIAILQTAIVFLHIPKIFLPLPSSVLSLLLYSKIPWLAHTGATVFEALTGFALAALFGVSAALAIHLSKTVRLVVEPLLLAAQVAPKVAIVPLLFLWLGFSPLPRVLTVFLVCFFPIVIDTTTGLSQVDPDLVDLVRLYRPTGLQVVGKVSLPSALPSVFSGFKVSITLAFVGAVIAEFVSSSYGLGYLILSAEANIDTTLAFAAITLLILVSLVAYGAVLLVEWAVVTRRR